MGLNSLEKPLTSRLSGCPGTAPTWRLANMPIHIVSLPSPACFHLDTSTKLHETEGALRISLSSSPSISLFISLLVQRFLASASMSTSLSEYYCLRALYTMQLTLAQILYNYAFEPFERAMDIISLRNISFATTGSSYCHFHPTTTSTGASTKRTLLCTIMSSGFAGRKISRCMFWPRKSPLSLLSL